MHTMLRDSGKESPEVRRLITRELDGPSLNVLQQLISGVVTEIDRGTEYEMREKAQAIRREWAHEGFRPPHKDKPVWESLKETVTLAKLMGFKVVHDPAAQDVRNHTGAVPLDRWPGRHGKNGGDYLYAFTGMEILASPTLPPGHGINLSPSSGKEFVSTMQQAIAAQKTVGPHARFPLA